MIFYRVSYNKYNPGDIIWENSIKPNNFSNMLIYKSAIKERQQENINKTYNFQQPFRSAGFDAAKEAILELVREEEFPGLPSRFGTMMAFNVFENATYFKNRYRPTCYIYEIEYPDDALHFCADMKMIDNAPNPKLQIDSLYIMARAYWNGEMTPSHLIEVILISPKATVKSLLS